MWRPMILVSLLLTLALGTAADAKCRVCIQSIRAEPTDSGTALRVEAQSINGATLPETATAVVMLINGNRSKCQNVPLRKTQVDGGTAAYRGIFTPFTNYPASTFTGRIDLNGDIFEFTVPTDGTPGTVQLVTAAAATEFAGTQQAVTTAAPTTALTAAPVSEAAPVADSGWQPLRQPMTWLALVAILATLGGAYLDRKRALARVTA